ncbi:MAG: Fur family transcriptional regulator [Stellaceae bacterium]
MARKSRIPAALVGLMARGKHHAWTLEELQAGLARDGSAADFSSVFRAAEKLAAEGAVRKLMLEDGRARFEQAGAHHDHLHCTRCDELVPMPCVVRANTFAALEARTGAAIAEHNIVFSGVCRNCRTVRNPRRKRR